MYLQKALMMLAYITNTNSAYSRPNTRTRSNSGRLGEIPRTSISITEDTTTPIKPRLINIKIRGSSAECVGRKVLHRQFSSLSFGSANGSAPSFSPSHRPSVAGARPMRRRGERGSQVILKKWTTKMHSVGRCVIGGGVTNIINTPPDRTECS